MRFAWHGRDGYLLAKTPHNTRNTHALSTKLGTLWQGPGHLRRPRNYYNPQKVYIQYVWRCTAIPVPTFVDFPFPSLPMYGCAPNSTHQNCKKEEKEKKGPWSALPCSRLLWSPNVPGPLLLGGPFLPFLPRFLLLSFCKTFPSGSLSRRDFCGCEGREAVEGISGGSPFACGGCTKMLGINQSRTPMLELTGLLLSNTLCYYIYLRNFLLNYLLSTAVLAGMNASSSLHYLRLHILF